MKEHLHPCAKPLAFLARWISGARVRWIDCAAEPRPRVYFANHSSHLDFVVLWAALPAPVRLLTHPVAALEYWQSTPLHSYLATSIFRSVLVPRHSATPLAGRGILQRLLAELDRGRSLIMFPEGQRGSGAEVGEFKTGLWQLCHARPDLEAVPVYLENLNRVLPKGAFLPRPRGDSRVTFGRPLRLNRNETNQQYLGRARQALQELRNR